MKHYQLVLISKNETSLTKFLLFLSKKFKKFIILVSSIKKKKPKNIVTILKSPHINKKAQEQFISDKFHCKITFKTNQHLAILLLIKKIKENLFLDINLKIKLLVSHIAYNKNKALVFNPSNFKTNLISNIKIKSAKKLKKIEKFAMLLDMFGEISQQVADSK